MGRLPLASSYRSGHLTRPSDIPKACGMLQGTEETPIPILIHSQIPGWFGVPLSMDPGEQKVRTQGTSQQGGGLPTPACDPFEEGIVK